jgi:hypothetical protein
MMQISFENDGRVSVYVYHDGTTVNVRTEVNRLRELLPGKVYDEMRARAAALVSMTEPPEAARLNK